MLTGEHKPKNIMELKEYNEHRYLEQEETFDVRSHINKLLDHWVMVLVCLVIALVMAFMANRLTTPVYNVTISTLVVQPHDTKNAVSEVLYGTDLFGVSVNLTNETYLFKALDLIERTLRTLNLNVSYYAAEGLEEIELYDSSPVTFSFREDASTNPMAIPYNKAILLTIVNDSQYKLEFEKGNLWERIKSFLLQESGTEDIFQDRTFNFDEWHDLNGFEFQVELDRAKNAPHLENKVVLKLFHYDNLKVQYQSLVDIQPLAPDASILEVSMKVNNRQKGVDYLNTLVDTYIDDELGRKNSTASKTINFINNQIMLMSDSLNQVENRLEEFKKSNATLTLSNEGNNYLQLGQSYDQGKSQLRLQNQYLNDLERYINHDNLEEIYIPSSIGLNDPNLNRSVRELVDLQLKIKSVSNLNNPIVASYQQRIALLKGSVLENIKSLRSANNYAIREFDRRMGTLNTTLRDLPTAEKEFVNIQRNYNLSEDLYLFLMQKKTEAGIALASNEIDYRVVNEARAEYRPVRPKPMFNYALALIAGFLLPLGFIFTKELLNNKVTSKEDLLKLTPIPYLGMIARNRGKEKLIYNGNARVEVAESFRTIRSNLRYMLGTDDGKGKCFLLTSSVSSEGKSFCSNNLAYVFSNFGKKVILVNADMRKENQYEIFGVENTIGLSDYLAGFKSKDLIIHRSELPNLSIIPSGGIPPNPSELLITGKFEELIKELKEEFDYVVVDTPPIGILADALELMSTSDVNIFVARQNYTLKQHIRDANQVYQTIQIKNMAILFNDVDVTKKQYGSYGKYYNNYYNKPTKISSVEKIFQKI